MCKHKNLVYLGKQELIRSEQYLALFNCIDCESTISLKVRKEELEEQEADTDSLLQVERR